MYAGFSILIPGPARFDVWMQSPLHPRAHRFDRNFFVVFFSPAPLKISRSKWNFQVGTGGVGVGLAEKTTCLS